MKYITNHGMIVVYRRPKIFEFLSNLRYVGTCTRAGVRCQTAGSANGALAPAGNGTLKVFSTMHVRV